jgi:hypothetical protein
MFLGLLACLAAIGLAVSTAAAAKPKTVTVGQNVTPTEPCSGPFTVLQTGVASGRSYTVPKAGVITSWSWEDGPSTVSGLKLAVARKVGLGRYEIVGTARAGKQTVDSIHTYKAHIPVKAGDVIGFSLSPSGAGSCVQGTTSTLNKYEVAEHVVPPGHKAMFHPGHEVKLPVSVRVTEAG